VVAGLGERATFEDRSLGGVREAFEIHGGPIISHINKSECNYIKSLNLRDGGHRLQSGAVFTWRGQRSFSRANLTL
jgi:hypothetical protein